MYGANGIGKTTFVKQFLSSVGYGYVDCIYNNSQDSISRHLYTTLISKYILPGNEMPAAFLDLVKSVKRNVVKGRKRYFIFDNVDRILKERLFREILSMERALKDYIRIVMVCNGCIPKLDFFNEFLATEELFTLLLMPPPTKERLKVILRNRVNNLINPEIYSLLIDLLHNEFSQYTTHIRYYSYLCKMIIPMLFKGIDLTTIKKEDFPQLYNKKLRKLGKWFISNFFVPIWDKKDMDSDINIDFDCENNLNNELCDPFNNNSIQIYNQIIKYGLTYLEGVALVAAYIACHNPERTDRTIFINNKR